MASNHLGRSKMERFLGFVSPEPNSGCWLWCGSLGNERYGIFTYDGTKGVAHRWIYQQLVGPIPPGLYACHKCDVPLCVNPNHIFLGTQAENLRDAVRKNRTSFGSQLPASKLTESEVIAIYSGRKSQRALAAEYGVGRRTIQKIWRRSSWARATAHLPSRPKRGGAHA